MRHITTQCENLTVGEQPTCHVAGPLHVMPVDEVQQRRRAVLLQSLPVVR